MVLRIAMALVPEKELDGLDTGVARLANEADQVREFLGDDLYPRLRHYVQELGHVVVRGRLPRVVVEDARERRQLWQEGADDLKRLPPAPVGGPASLQRTVKNHLRAKPECSRFSCSAAA